MLRHRPLTLDPARLWRSSLRLRLTATGTLLAAAIFAIASPIAITFYHRSLTNSVWNTVTEAAQETARQLPAKLKSAEALPRPSQMPVSPVVPRIQNRRFVLCKIARPPPWAAQRSTYV